ncbi:PLP-dependent aminotransferase family protein [Paraflavitalea soli]|uniref:PLP-dependent aminotransferase family protein n=1 Tax=Paraflavitalea soli TaxID=2315862 RepID=A0A3B7MPL7_9BACT|nr:PLP-dependent aminotransferase family protein [Paraflavitalea soli]AXY76442.1 PLP-dependent aminotransferase family protein [Paraflavitalea soli]
MLPFQTLIRPDKKATTPIYQQVANRLVSLIREGIIKPGAALPGSREMAELLQLHRKTIVAAYEELNAQDWIETIPRKGVFVAPNLPDIKPRRFTQGISAPYAGNTGFSFNKQLSFPVPSTKMTSQRLLINDGLPDTRLAPMDALLREYRSLVKNKNMHAMIERPDPSGFYTLREAMVMHLSATRGLNIQANNVLMTRGAQMAIFLAAQLLIQPGDYVAVGDPNYYLASLLFEQAGARLIQIPVDEQGMEIDALAAACRKKKIRMVYVIPHHHHPTTATLSAERRMQLLELVRQYKLAVIEDDYDFSFHYDSAPILPLASTQHEGCVIYIGSVTKVMTPSLRIGFMVAPDNFIKQAVNLRRLVDSRGDNLMEATVANLMKNGDIGRHIKKSNKTYHERRDMFVPCWINIYRTLFITISHLVVWLSGQGFIPGIPCHLLLPVLLLWGYL